MNNYYRKGAMGALLDEYEKAVEEFKTVVSGISTEELVNIKVKNDSTASGLWSLQEILAHVISSGYSYCVYIIGSRGVVIERPERQLRSSAKEYLKDINEMFKYSCGHLSLFGEDELEETDPSKKILTSWGQVYDIEQMMEHSIVHILRHRRHVVRLLSANRGES